MFVTEFGHSMHRCSKSVGPWSREIYILHFVVRGYCDFSGFRAEEGQAFFISREHLHAFTISDDYEHYWIGFMGNSVKKLFSAFSLTSDSHQLFFVENPAFAKALFSLTEEKLQNSEADSPESFVLSLLTAMLPLLTREKQSVTVRKINYAEQTKLFIEANYAYPIKMIDIANALHLSEKYMYRIFKEKYAIPPQRFLLKTRMEAARVLLMHNNISIKETAYAVGYTSLPAFSKVFSKYHGVSPSLFRI